MPELAEVETLKRYLEKHILHSKIENFKQYRDNLRYQLAKNLAITTEGGRIENIRRRAKYLLLDLSNSNSVVVHLGMSGRFTIESNIYQRKKHDHILIDLHDDRKLVLNDARRFGMFYVVPTHSLDQQQFIREMGVEPLENQFNPEYLKSQINNKNRPIKNCIMDNRIVVGVGNIYAAESLFAARIHPEKKASSLSDNEISILTAKIKEILQKAIAAGGTTLRDFVSGDSAPGYFKQELEVYGRENEPCNICGNPIKSIKQSGRTTFFCTNCQS